MHNCSALENWDAPPSNFSYADRSVPSTDLPSNPDIAGVGVVVAFVASAYMTLVLVLAYYVSGCVEEAQQNPIDRGVLRVTRKWLQLKRKPGEIWEDSIRKAVLMFSDQQLVTGLAILGSGFSQLQKGITAYHWQITVYLAWFSSLTHLTLLTVLRDYFRQHSGIRNWRLGLMTATLALLVAALVPTGTWGWMSRTWKGYLGAVPTICFLQRPSKSLIIDMQSSNGVSMVLSIVILAFGYISRAIKLSSAASTKTQMIASFGLAKPMRWTLDKLYKRLRTTGFRLHWVCLYVTVFTAYAFLRMVRDIYTSVIGEILWLTLALLWGSLHLFYTRSTLGLRNPLYGKVIAPAEDNLWSFGQCIAVILLAFPLISMAESYLECQHLSRRSAKTEAKGVDAINKLQNQMLEPGSLASAPRKPIALGVTGLSNSDKIDIALCNDSQSSAAEITGDEATRKAFRAAVRVNTDELDLEDKIYNTLSTAVKAPHYWDLYNFVWYRMLICQGFFMITGQTSVFLSTVGSVDVYTLCNLGITASICVAISLFWTSTNVLVQMIPLMRPNQMTRRASGLGKVRRIAIQVWMWMVYLTISGVTQWCAVIFVYKPNWYAGGQ